MKEIILFQCLAIAFLVTSFHPARPTCNKASVDFEQPLLPGTIFNTLRGTVYNNGYGFVVRLGKLTLPSGAQSFNQSKVLNTPPFTFGTGQLLRMNNTTLNFDVTMGRITLISIREATCEYLDQGGTINIGANGTVNLYVGNMSAMPATLVINGVTITKIAPTPILNAQGTKVAEKGTLSFKFSYPLLMRTIIIGGQELFLDNFCFNG